MEIKWFSKMFVSMFALKIIGYFKAFKKYLLVLYYIYLYLAS